MQFYANFLRRCSKYCTFFTSNALHIFTSKNGIYSNYPCYLQFLIIILGKSLKKIITLKSYLCIKFKAKNLCIVSEITTLKQGVYILQ